MGLYVYIYLLYEMFILIKLFVAKGVARTLPTVRETLHTKPRCDKPMFDITLT